MNIGGRRFAGRARKGSGRVSGLARGVPRHRRPLAYRKKESSVCMHTEDFMIL